MGQRPDVSVGGRPGRWYPLWVRHGLLRLGEQDVMRFLGRHTPVTPGKYGRFAGEVVTDVKERVEGAWKRRVNDNSVKIRQAGYGAARGDDSSNARD